MGTLVVSEFISLDGVIDSPGDDSAFDRGGWAFRFDRGPDGSQLKFDELMAAEALLLGRITYDGFADAWPQMTGAGEYGERMNGLPKYVASTTLVDPTWNNTEVLPGDLAEDVTKLKERYDGDILVFGSGQLVQALAEHGLVDEYRLMVSPCVVGAGKRLFGETTRIQALELVSAVPTGPDGIVVLTYRPIPNE